MMQQPEQEQPTVEEIQYRANLVIKSLSNKIANVEVVNANLLAEIDILRTDLQQASEIISKISRSEKN